MQGRRVTRALGVVAMAVVLVATGCSGGESDDDDQATPTTSARGMPRACDLVTAKEAESVLGTPPKPPTAEAERCTWSASDDRGFVTVALRQADDPKPALEASRATDRGEAVSGIGDAAYLSLPAPELGIVAFVRAQTMVSILVRSPGRNRETLLDLARTSAGRI